MKQRHHHSMETFARLDYFRKERTGIPEVVFAEGKEPEQVLELTASLADRAGIALATRVAKETAGFVEKKLGPGLRSVYHSSGRVLVVTKEGWKQDPSGGAVAVLSAGTSDVPIAEEARITAEVMGCKVMAFYDVGVAGIHRLVEPLEEIQNEQVSAVVAVAGMEGALPTVVRGLVAVPVIGVPTSVGYGYGGKGKAALMTMLQSCAPGLTVVNIDNGFGAGATAALIANAVAAERIAAQTPAGNKNL